VSVFEYEYLLWISVACYAVHVIEEKMLGWRSWAKAAIHLDLPWSDFYVVNAAAITIGIACAMVGWQEPAFALAFPALALINAIFFHIAPTLIQRRISPGIITAIVIQIPVGIWVFVGADRDGVLSAGNVVLAVIIGALLMATAVVFPKLAERLKLDTT
jgi:hypothetical protein